MIHAQHIIRKYRLPQHQCVYYNPSNHNIDKLRGLVRGSTYLVTEDKLTHINDWGMYINQIQLMVDNEENKNLIRQLLDRKQYEHTINLFETYVSTMYKDELKRIVEFTVISTWFLKFFTAGISLPESINISKFLYDEREENRLYDVNSILTLLLTYETCSTVLDKDTLEKLLNRKEDI